MPIFSRRVAALPLAALALALPHTALGADAPSRFFAITPSGEQAYSPNVFGLSPDGNEVAMNITADRTSANTVAAIRNLSANTTTQLLPAGSYLQGASTDLQRVLYSTSARVDPALDTNGDTDYYVYDRSTRKSTLVSRTLAGLSAAQGYSNVAPALMPDGRSVLYNTIAPDPAGLVRLTVDTGAITRISSDELLLGQQFDRAGRVIVTTAGGILVDGRSIPDPGASQYGTTKYLTSPDGGTVVEQPYSGGLQVVSTATGASRSVTIPAALSGGFRVVRAENGGASALVSTVVGSGSTHANKLSRFDFASGAVTQLGGNLPDAPSTDLPMPITDDLSFVASTQYVSAIGTKPLPGAAQPIPPVNPAEFVRLHPGCSYANVFQQTIKAFVNLSPLAIGVDPRTPKSAVVSILNKTTGAIINQFTLAAPNAERVISPANGDFTLRATVTYTDGQTLTGTRYIAAYTPPKNDKTPFNVPSGICEGANR